MVGCDVETGVEEVMELVKQSLGKFAVIHVSKAGPELKIVYHTATTASACMFGWRHTLTRRPNRPVQNEDIDLPAA